MKWIKRLFIFLLVLAIGAGVAIGVSYWMLRRTPDWYKPVAMDSAEMEAAANRAFNKVVAIHNMADQAAAQDSAREHGTAKGTTKPAVEPITVTFTQEELTAFIVKWSSLHSDTVNRYVTGPQFILRDGLITFGGQIAEFHQFGSLSVEPSLDDKAQLRLDISSINIGTLPAPRSLVQGKLTKVETMLRGWLPAWQDKAKIEAGGANADAVKAAMTELLLNTLHDRPSQPVFFMPIADHKNVPVKLADVKVNDGSITMTVEPLTAEDRKSALQTLRQPYAAETASADLVTPPPARQ
jgi:hypothetical protein